MRKLPHPQRQGRHRQDHRSQHLHRSLRRPRLADCDVDAPNLHLVSGAFTESSTKDYHDLPKAFIDPELCTACGICHEVCRFGAIREGEVYRVNPIACEGCTYCQYVCPEGAITMQKSIAGEIFLHRRGDHVFSTATLKMGSGTTGKLVTAVKDQIKDAEAPLAILDGSPGIGCPVIASLTGSHLALMVAEPSVSGLSDLKRVVASARQLDVPVAVVVNKADINDEQCAPSRPTPPMNRFLLWGPSRMIDGRHLSQ